jgi:hypothetical protein
LLDATNITPPLPADGGKLPPILLAGNRVFPLVFQWGATLLAVICASLLRLLERSWPVTSPAPRENSSPAPKISSSATAEDGDKHHTVDAAQRPYRMPRLLARALAQASVPISSFIHCTSAKKISWILILIPDPYTTPVLLINSNLLDT